MALPSLSWEMLYEIAEWTIRLGAVVVVQFRRKFTAAAWLLLIFFLPIPGLLLFLMIGRAAVPERSDRTLRAVAARLQPHRHIASQAQARASFAGFRICREARLLPRDGGQPGDLLGDYDATRCDRLVADIEAAEERVFSPAVYIFADDEVGCRVIDALGRAIDAGSTAVSCSIRSVRCTGYAGPSNAFATWASAPPPDLAVGASFADRTRRDMRNHRKLFIIDGRIGYAGSQNIVSKWLPPGRRPTGNWLSAAAPAPFGDGDGSRLPRRLVPGDRQQHSGIPSSQPHRREAPFLQLMPSGPEYPLEGFETLLVWQMHQAPSGR